MKSSVDSCESLYYHSPALPPFVRGHLVYKEYRKESISDRQAERTK